MFRVVAVWEPTASDVGVFRCGMHLAPRPDLLCVAHAANLGNLSAQGGFHGTRILE